MGLRSRLLERQRWLKQFTSFRLRDGRTNAEPSTQTEARALPCFLQDAVEHLEDETLLGLGG